MQANSLPRIHSCCMQEIEFFQQFKLGRNLYHNQRACSIIKEWRRFNVYRIHFDILCMLVLLNSRHFRFVFMNVINFHQNFYIPSLNFLHGAITSFIAVLQVPFVPSRQKSLRRNIEPVPSAIPCNVGFGGLWVAPREGGRYVKKG